MGPVCRPTPRSASRRRARPARAASSAACSLGTDPAAELLAMESEVARVQSCPAGAPPTGRRRRRRRRRAASPEAPRQGHLGGVIGVDVQRPARERRDDRHRVRLEQRAAAARERLQAAARRAEPGHRLRLRDRARRPSGGTARGPIEPAQLRVLVAAAPRARRRSPPASSPAGRREPRVDPGRGQRRRDPRAGAVDDERARPGAPSDRGRTARRRARRHRI